MDAARHFGLTRDPFAPTVDPTAAFESQAFIAARENVLRELRQGARLVALVGAAGTGKTLLLQALEARLAGEGRQVRRVDRGDIIDAAAPADLLLIDEADRMDDAALTALARTAADPARPAAVLALTRRRLDHLDLPVAPRFVELDELATNDARDFVIDRVRRAGGDAALFTPGALGAITYAAAGSPRLLRLLSSGALFQAAQDGAARIEMGHARRAIAMQRGGQVEPPTDAEDEPLAVAAPEPEPVAVPAPVAVSPRAERRQAAPPASRPVVAPPAVAAPIIAPVDAPPPPPEPPPAAPAPAPPPLPVPAPVATPVEPVPPPPREPTDEAEFIERRGVQKRHLVAAGVVAALLAGGTMMLWRADRPTADPSPPAPAVASAPPPAPEVTRVAEAPVVAPQATEPEPEPAAVATPDPASVPAPAPPAPVATAPLTPPKVVVRFAGSQPGAADAAGRIADLLRARGFEVAEVRAAPGRVRQASTRYAAGERIAGEALNRAFETVLRAYQPGAESRTAPSAEGEAARGIIEVWVPDSAAGASRPLRTDLPPG